MPTTTTVAVEITSPTTIPLSDDVLITWKTDSSEILGFDVRIGTEEGSWDVLNCGLGAMVREVSLPNLSKGLTKLYLEFGYVVPSNAMEHGHASENILLSEKPIPIWRK